MAGTIFVHKIAGAAAEQGKSLAEVKAVAEKVIANVKSIGFAMTSCTVPAKGSPTFELGENEMEYGVGIHGEPGVSREELKSSEELAARLVSSLSNELQLNGQERIAVIVNGFGGTPLMELYLFYYNVAQELSAKGITVARVFVGNYMTSIDMAGASLSILKLDDELETLLNAPANTAALKVDGAVDIVPFMNYFPAAEKKSDACFGIETPTDYAKIDGQLTLDNMKYLVDAMSACIIENEVPFCELDAHAGDGDFGMSVAKGFHQLKVEWKDIVENSNDISSFLDACSMVIMEHCGGASGPIWGSAFRAAGKSVAGKDSLSVVDFAEMLQSAVTGIQNTGSRSFGRGAVVGDKTLIDALVPCADAWSKYAECCDATFTEAFDLGAKAAVAGAKSTESIVARMGRAGTVGERSLGYPDAGAYALGVIFTHLSNLLKASSV